MDTRSARSHNLQDLRQWQDPRYNEDICWFVGCKVFLEDQTVPTRFLAFPKNFIVLLVANLSCVAGQNQRWSAGYDSNSLRLRRAELIGEVSNFRFEVLRRSIRDRIPDAEGLKRPCSVEDSAKADYSDVERIVEVDISDKNEPLLRACGRQGSP